MSDDVSLEQIRIASPCPVEWDSMSGDDRVRFCGECKLNVYDIASMTRAEALDFVRRAEGRVCVQLHRRTDGTVLTSDCPVGLRAARRQLARMVAKIAAIVMLTGSALGMYRLSRDATGTRGVASIEPFASIERWLAPPERIHVFGGVMISPNYFTPQLNGGSGADPGSAADPTCQP